MHWLYDTEMDARCKRFNLHDTNNSFDHVLNEFKDKIGYIGDWWQETEI